MRLNNLAKNLRGPWMMEPEQAAIMIPVLKAVLSGQTIQTEQRTQPYKALCNDYLKGTTVEASAFEGKSIYVTSLSGTLMRYDNECGGIGTMTIARELLQADADPEVIGHIIIADSGGGQSDAVSEMTDAIAKCSKPVVAWIDGTAASACIYSIATCNKILAHRDINRVGCIGTMVTLSGYGKFHRDPDGYVTARIYADTADEKNLEYEKALEGETKLIKESFLNPINERFISDMKAARPNALEEQMHGRTYFAKEVIGTLIDGLGTFEDAVNEVLLLAQASTAAAASSNQKPNSSSNMKRFVFLAAIASLAKQSFAEDNTTTLQLSQMEDIENEIARQANLASERQTTIDSLNETLSQRDATIQAHESTIAQRDARIQELETSLTAALERAENAGAPGITPKNNASGTGEIHGSDDFESALAECESFLKR